MTSKINKNSRELSERITGHDVTLQVRGTWYRIPWQVLAADEDIRREFDLYDVNTNGTEAGMITAGIQLYEWINYELEKELYMIRSNVALYEEKYKSYTFYP